MNMYELQALSYKLLVMSFRLVWQEPHSAIPSYATDRNLPTPLGWHKDSLFKHQVLWSQI